MSDGDGGVKLLYNPHIFVCLEDKECRVGEGCCGEKGAGDLFGHMRAYAKSKGVTGIRVNRASCLERCELGPVMVLYPEGVWYAFRTQADVEEIVDTHVIGGGRVERLMLAPGHTPADLAAAGE